MKLLSPWMLNFLTCQIVKLDLEQKSTQEPKETSCRYEFTVKCSLTELRTQNSELFIRQMTIKLLTKEYELLIKIQRGQETASKEIFFRYQDSHLY